MVGATQMQRLSGNATVSAHAMMDTNGTIRYLCRSDGNIYVFDENGKTMFDLWRNGTSHNIFKIYDASGNAIPMIELISDSVHGQISLSDLDTSGSTPTGKERNFLGAGRIGCYDANGTEKARLTYENNGTLNLGGVTMTSAQLQRLLALI